MFLSRFCSALVLALFLAAQGLPARAASISSAQTSTLLGQPLAFPVQVRLDEGDVLLPECLSAEVTLGERRLADGMVRAVIDSQSNGLARVRVLSLQVIDEPVVGINVRVSCRSPMQRRFVVFADPPSNVASAAPSYAANPTPVQALPPPVASVAAPPAAASVVAAGPRPSDARAPKRPVVRRVRPRPRPAARVAAASPGKSAPDRAPAAGGKDETGDKPNAGSRLTLEPVLGSTAVASARTEGADAIDNAMAAVAQAASSAQAAASAAAAAADRVALLERTVSQLRTEAQAARATNTQLREQLAQAQTPGISNWVWPLLLTSLALAGLVAWLAWRLGRLQSSRQVAWKQAAGPGSSAPLTSQATPSAQRSGPLSDGALRVPTGPAPFLGSDLSTQPPLGTASAATQAARDSLGSRAGSAWTSSMAPRSAVDDAMARTEPLPASLRSEAASVRDVSIEELIDLEQQAEFFVVLGQDDAAVDLLVDHLRSTGGGSPLPYLKLLEIYSRRGDRPAYERNRARFNHRFNAYAPEWGSDLAHGRSLEDYPGILPRLEQVWPRPLDAMAELEALLFRKSRGELFELPAYREVLFLYSLARDLLDRESADTGTVDLLLPLADGTEFGSTAPAPFIDAPDFVDRHAPLDFDDRPTGPVDFDLTIPAQQASIFDPIDESQRPKRN